MANLNCIYTSYPHPIPLYIRNEPKIVIINVDYCIFMFDFNFAGNCKSPLGMESGAIADFQITASSAHDIGNVGPQHARYVYYICVYVCIINGNF